MIPILIYILLFSQVLSSKDIYVGYPDKEINYFSIQSAVNRAALINREKESIGS